MTQEQAATIFQQLGGTNRLKAMIGAKYVTMDSAKNEVGFRFSLNRKMNYCRITLTCMDLYTVEFLKIKKTTVDTVKTFDGVYGDQLKSIFEETTGLDLSL